MLHNKTINNLITNGNGLSNGNTKDADVLTDDATNSCITQNGASSSNSNSNSNGNTVPVILDKQRRHRNRCYVSLACSIGSMGLACGSLLQIPNTTDRITLQRGLFLTSLGFIYFVSLTDFCNQYFLETSRGLQFRKKYRLMMSDVLEITNKIVSAIQAFFSFLVGFIVCKSTCSKSFVYASHFLMEAYGWFGTAYFMYDIWSMYKVHTQKIADKLNLMKSKTLHTTNGNRANKGSNGHLGNGSLQLMYDKAANDGNGTAAAPAIGKHMQQQQQQHHHHEDDFYDYDGACVEIPKDGRWDFLKYVVTHPVMMIHHVFIGTFGLLVVTYIRGGGHCIYSYMFMMEFSTPFVSLRGILSTMGLKESRVYFINGLMMLGSFFVCRVFMWPYVMWRYSIAIDTSFWQALTGLPSGCIISILILFLPQVYWFYLMVKGAIKVFFPSGKSRLKQQEQQQNDVSCKNENMSGNVVDAPNIEISSNDSRQTELLCQAALGENSAN